LHFNNKIEINMDKITILFYYFFKFYFILFFERDLNE